ncbi:MAG: Crp/Fnr family transcriptional regulator [Gammaproteobacteria bacterium]|nr:Crp/Fnr family transcriptional regulator [Gammaproteobacteria bacterium]
MIRVPGEAYSSEVKWIGRADCRHCENRKNTLFGALTNKEVEELPALVDQFEFPPNYRIYTSGDLSDNIYTIREGFVKAVALTADGTERIVRLYKPGDVVGLEALTNASYQHTIMAMGTVSVCRFPAKIIKRLLGKSAKLSEQLLKQWQVSIERADHWLTHLTTGTVESRVAWLLKLLVGMDETENQLVIKLPANIDIAAIIDTTVESVSRTVAEMKRKKILTRVAPRTYRCDLTKISG